MPDLNIVKSNVSKMVSMGAPESDIDSYIQAEGTTVDAIRNFNGRQATPSRDYATEMKNRNPVQQYFQDAQPAFKVAIQHPETLIGKPALKSGGEALTPEELAGAGNKSWADIYRGANLPGSNSTSVAGQMMPQIAGEALDMGTRPSSFIAAAKPLQEGVEQLTQKAWGAIKGGGEAIGNIGKNLKPTIYNDEFVANTTKSVAQKIQSVIQPLKDTYQKILEPYQQQSVDSSTFQQALKTIPTSMRKQFAEDYGSQVVDAAGKPTTTVDGLQRMEQQLKDIAYSQKFGERMDATEFDAARAAGKVKDIRFAQLPEEVSAQIKQLDSKYGPAIEAGDALLPKLMSNDNLANTQFLYRTFKNPAAAGMRDYLLNLKSIGVNLNPEIKATRGWVARQGQKRAVKSIASKAVGGGILGEAIKHGL